MTPSAFALSAYAADLAVDPWESLPHAGGFSGARIWQSNGRRLKAWPRGDISAEHLRDTHVWMRHAASLEFVPHVQPTKTGDTLVAESGWLWDLVTWMPGEPLLREPTPARLAAAGRCLARLHQSWQSCSPRMGACPAVHRRLHALQIPLGPERIDAQLQDRSVRPLIELARRLIPGCRTELQPWTRIELRLHPCLCDVWSDHVLFTNDDVSGLIDFGAAKIDHPAVDLARLLGDCLVGEPNRWHSLLDAYHAIRPLTPADHSLIAALERTGAVVAMLTWIVRLRDRAPLPAELERIEKLILRCERMA